MPGTSRRPLPATLEILYRAFVLLSSSARRERAEIAPFSGLRIDLARVEAVLAEFDFSDHGLRLLPLPTSVAVRPERRGHKVGGTPIPIIVIIISVSITVNGTLVDPRGDIRLHAGRVIVMVLDDAFPLDNDGCWRLDVCVALPIDGAVEIRSESGSAEEEERDGGKG
jgi:hypothetical protein